MMPTKSETYVLAESATQPVALGNGLWAGDNNLLLIAGPCSVESYEQTRSAAETVARCGGQVLRGGAFKPRTYPHSFRGLGEAGLEILRSVADEFGLLVVTEALAVADLPLVTAYSDIIQIGSRNMQHFPLLWAVGRLDKPVLLKRGFMATVDEWLAAAEHIASEGNQRIVLAERGIRTFETATRNTLDINAIALVKQLSHYPIIADPSHATGRSELVLPAALASVAAGADGLIVEIHPNPTEALSDGRQSLSLEDFPNLVHGARAVAQAVGRDI